MFIRRSLFVFLTKCFIKPKIKLKRDDIISLLKSRHDLLTT